MHSPLAQPLHAAYDQYHAMYMHFLAAQVVLKALIILSYLEASSFHRTLCVSSLQKTGARDMKRIAPGLLFKFLRF